MYTNEQIPFKHRTAEGIEMQPLKTTALMEIKELEFIEYVRSEKRRLKINRSEKKGNNRREIGKNNH